MAIGGDSRVLWQLARLRKLVAMYHRMREYALRNEYCRKHDDLYLEMIARYVLDKP